MLTRPRLEQGQNVTERLTAKIQPGSDSADALSNVFVTYGKMISSDFLMPTTARESMTRTETSA